MAALAVAEGAGGDPISQYGARRARADGLHQGNAIVCPATDLARPSPGIADEAYRHVHNLEPLPGRRKGEPRDPYAAADLEGDGAGRYRLQGGDVIGIPGVSARLTGIEYHQAIHRARETIILGGAGRGYRQHPTQPAEDLETIIADSEPDAIQSWTAAGSRGTVRQSAVAASVQGPQDLHGALAATAGRGAALQVLCGAIGDTQAVGQSQPDLL